MGLVEALKVIKKTCECFECQDCPLGDEDCLCKLDVNKKAPCDWNIKAEINL